nr:large polymerase [Paraavulavirus hongkongense]
MSNQAAEIILPTFHLESPLIENKCFYYMQLLGLVLPHDHWRWRAFVNFTVDQVHLKNRNPRLMAHIDHTKDRLRTHGVLGFHQTQTSLSRYRVLLHPETLPWLSAMGGCINQVPKAWRNTLKSIEHSVKQEAPQLKLLMERTSVKLTGVPYLFSNCNPGKTTAGTMPVLSEMASELLSNPISQFQSTWGCAASGWHHVVSIMRLQQYQRRTGKEEKAITEVQYGTDTCLINADYTVVFSTQNRVITVLPFDVVLMMQDLLESRRNVLFCARFMYPRSQLHERISTILALGDQLGRKAPQVLYDFVATLESFAYAAVQLHDNNPTYGGAFFEFNIQELESILSPALSKDQVNFYIGQVVSAYSNLPPSESAELLCLLRLWGHPLLNSLDAAKKVRESMCAGKVLDYNAIRLVLSFYHTLLINGYRKKHKGRWPNVNQHSLLNPIVRQLYFDQEEIPHSVALEHYLDVSMIEFEKTFEVELSDSLSIFLKDKSIALDKQEWYSGFVSEVTPKHLRMSRHDRKSTNRLLLAFINSPEFDIKEELKYLTTGEYATDPNFNVSYSLKEKEVKKEGRIFAKMSQKMRACQVICEELLAHHVAPLFKENGVTQSELSLTKNLLAISQLSYNSMAAKVRLLRPGDKFTAAHYMTTDLKKYCLNWRHQSVKLFARSLDRLFGLDHAFSWIHVRLTNSTMYVADPFNPPDSEACTNLDDNKNTGIFIISARGGIEGLQQKLWTGISIAIAQAAAALEGLRIAATLQGDNQVLAITKEFMTPVPEDVIHEQLSEAMSRYKRTFTYLNYLMGHQLKDKETIQSSDFFVYSKRIFFNGSILSQCLKNFSKLTTNATTLAENTVAGCSDISSCIARCVENGLPKDAAYIQNIIMTRLQLLLDHYYSMHGGINSELEQPTLSISVRNATYLPSQLGGYNHLNMTRLFCRNIGDPLTSSWAESKRLMDVGLLSRKFLEGILWRPPGSGTFSTLMLDPFALNIDYLRPPETIIRKHTQKVLLQDCPNPLLAGVVDPNYNQELELLAQFLLDRETVIPRAAHAIFELSVLGRKKHIQGLVDTTKTIIQCSLERQPLSWRKVENIVTYNAQYFLGATQQADTNVSEGQWVMPGNFKKLVSLDDCSVTLSTVSRRISWANLLNWRAIDGLETPDVIESIDGRLVQSSNQCGLCNQGLGSYSWFFLPSGCVFDRPQDSRVVPKMPYVGSKTDERQTASVQAIQGSTCHLRAALRLVSLYLWAYGDSDISWLEAATLAQTRCNVSLDDLRILSPLPSSANLHHRLNDGVTQVKFMPATSSRVSKFVQICNDNQNLIRDDGSVDSNMIYQQVMILGLGEIECLLADPIDTNPEQLILHLHSDNSCCLREMPTTGFVPALGLTPCLTVPKHNPYIYDDSPIPGDLDQRLIQTKFFMGSDNLDNLDIYQQRALLSRCVAYDVIQSIFACDAPVSQKNDAILHTDYHENWISEFRWGDPRIIQVTAGYELILFLAYQLYYLRVRGDRAILCYIDRILNRMVSSNLGSLIQTLSHPEIRRRFSLSDQGFLVERELEPGKPLVKQAVMFLRDSVRCALATIKAGIEPEISRGGCTQDELSFTLKHLLCRRLCVIALMHSEAKNLVKVRNLPVEEKTALLYQMLVTEANARKSGSASIIINLVSAPQWDIHTPALYFVSKKMLGMLKRSTTPLDISDLSESPNPAPAELNDVPGHMAEEFPCLFSSYNATYEDTITYNPMTEKLALHLDNSSTPSRALGRHYILRPLGLYSSAWYRSAALLASGALNGLPEGSSLYLGEGYGTTMTLLEPVVKSSTVYYHTLFDPTRNPSQRNYKPEPRVFTDSIWYKDDFTRPPGGIINLWGEDIRQSDITQKDTVNFILSQIPPKSLKLIHVDIEFSPDSDVRTLLSGYSHCALLAYWLLQPGGRFAVRVFLSDHIIVNLVTAILSAFDSNLVCIASGLTHKDDGAGYICAKKLANVEASRIEYYLRMVHGCVDSLKIPHQLGIIKWAEGEVSQLTRKADDEINWRLGDPVTRSFDPVSELIIARTGGSVLMEYGAFTNLRCANLADTYKLLASIVETTLMEIRVEQDQLEDNSRRQIQVVPAFNTRSGGRIRTLIECAQLQIIDVMCVNIDHLFPKHRHVLVTQLTYQSVCLGDLIEGPQIKTYLRARKWIQRRGLNETVNHIITGQVSRNKARDFFKRRLKLIGFSLCGGWSYLSL